jgi:hypothetical protein
MKYLPIEDQDGEGAEDLTKVKESLGIIGLNLMSIGFDIDNTMTLSELQNISHEIVNEEIQCLSPKQDEEEKKEENTKMKMTQIQRRSSLLRETGRCVTDARSYVICTPAELFETWKMIDMFS